MALTLWQCFPRRGRVPHAVEIRTQRIPEALAMALAFFFLRKTSSKSALGHDDNCGETGEGWIGEKGKGEKALWETGR